MDRQEYEASIADENAKKAPMKRLFDLPSDAGRFFRNEHRGRKITTERQQVIDQVGRWLYGNNYTDKQVMWIRVRMTKEIPPSFLLDVMKQCIEWGKAKGVLPQKAFKTIFLSSLSTEKLDEK